MRKLDHCNIVRLRYFFYSSGEKVHVAEEPVQRDPLDCEPIISILLEVLHFSDVLQVLSVFTVISCDIFQTACISNSPAGFGVLMIKAHTDRSAAYKDAALKSPHLHNIMVCFPDITTVNQKRSCT